MLCGGRSKFAETSVDVGLGMRTLPVILKPKLLALPYPRYLCRLPSIRFHHIAVEVINRPANTDGLKMRGVFYSNFYEKSQPPGQRVTAMLVVIEPGLTGDVVQHLLECGDLLLR